MVMAATVNNRITTVKKKAGELATLSGAEVGLVCFMPDGSFFTWPPEQNKVRSTLLRYNQLLLHHQLPNPTLDSKKRKRIDPSNPNFNSKKRKPNSQTLDDEQSLLDANIQESIHPINLVESGQNQLEFDALVQEWESGVPSAEIQELDIHSELGHSQLEKEASSQCAGLGLTVAQELEPSDAHLHELDPWIQVDNQLQGAGLDDFIEELEACLPCDDDLQGLDKNEPQSQVDNQLEEAGFDGYVEELEACLPCDDDLQALEKNEPWVQVGDVESGHNELEFDAPIQEWECCVPSDEIQELDFHSNNMVGLGHNLLEEEEEVSSLGAELGLTVAQSPDAHLHELDPWIQVDNQLEEAGLDDFVEELEACLPCDDDDDLQGLDKNEPQSQVDNQVEEVGFDDEYVEELEACLPCDDDLQALENNEPWVQVGDGQADSGVLGLTNEELQLWIHPDSTYVQELEAWVIEREEARGSLEH